MEDHVGCMQYEANTRLRCIRFPAMLDDRLIETMEALGKSFDHLVVEACSDRFGMYETPVEHPFGEGEEDE